MDAITIGTPVYSRDRAGHVVGVKDTGPPAFTLGTGRMEPVRSEVEVAFETHLTEVPDTIARDWIETARRYQLQPISEEEAAARRRDLLEKRDQAREDRRREEEERERAAAAFLADAENRIPAGSKAVLYAELRESECDSMTDYFGSRAVRTIILGFSTHTRDLFSEMRKAARNHPETAHLADLGPDGEQRDKHSMGAGYYLKADWIHRSGWCVRKRSISGVNGLPVCAEWATDTQPAPAVVDQVPGSGEGVRIEEHAHSKQGFAMFLVVMAERVERDRFEFLRDAAKAAGGWYSRAWSRTPAGFAFKDRAAAESFMTDHFGATQAPAAAATDGEAAPVPAPAVASSPTRPAGAGIAAKFRTMADALQSQIDDKFRDRRRNTPKQQREAQSARLDGYHLERAQKGLRALADAHDAGTVPSTLASVKTKAEVLELARGRIESSGGYYDAGHETGDPANDTPAARAFWALVGGTSPADQAAEKLRTQIDALRFAKIPGFFQTPPTVVARMVEAADIPDGAAVLEPSAGAGAILDAVREAAPAARLVVYERHLTLRQILEAKGYAVTGDDFTGSDLSLKVERVLMNPPFENLQDIDHVRRAFEHLTPGGRLVAIMSQSPFFRETAKARDFRDWFDSLGGDRVDLPAGAFKESGTGVASVMVVLDKDGEPAPRGEILEPQDPGADPSAPAEVAPAVPDLADVRGHETAKRALEIAAAGGLSVYLRAGPGQGKTMLLEAASALADDFDGREGRRPPSGPVDLCLDLCPVSTCDVILPPPAETTAMVRERVQAARRKLWPYLPAVAPLHSAMKTAEEASDEQARRLMATAAEHMRLTPEDIARTWRVALAIAALDTRTDPEDARRVGRIHVAEALSYRRTFRPNREKSEAERCAIRRAWDMRRQLRELRSAAQPAPAASGLEKAERDHLEGEIDRLRAIVADQAAQLQTCAGQAEVVEDLRRQVERERSIADTAFGQVRQLLASRAAVAAVPAVRAVPLIELPAVSCRR